MRPRIKRPLTAPSAVSVALLLVLASCGPVHENVKPTADAGAKVKRLAVVIPEEGEFTVYYERAKATATGAVLFGLIGAAVSSAHNQSLDNKKAEALRTGLTDVSCLGLFRDTLRKTLEDSKRFDDVRVFGKEPDSKERSQFDAVATFRIREWGFRLVERGPTDKVASFIDLEIRMVEPAGDKVLWDEHDTVIGKGKHLLSEFEGDPALCGREVAETAQNAGYKVATTLIYH